MNYQEYKLTAVRYLPGTLVRMRDGTLAEVINMVPQDGWNISVRPLNDQEVGIITHAAHLTVVPPEQDPMLS